MTVSVQRRRDKGTQRQQDFFDIFSLDLKTALTTGATGPVNSVSKGRG